MNSTPIAPALLGYRWPAEWEPHRATWVAWPHNQDTWPGRYDRVPGQFVGLVRAISECEPVNVLAGGAEAMRAARQQLGRLEQVVLWDVPTDDAWCRDHGPTFLQGPPGGEPALVDWQYNAWGGKYPPYDQDNAVPRRIAALGNYRRFAPQVVLEGGAIEGNGRGLLLTTASCLLDPHRNPQWDAAGIEQVLGRHLGAQQVAWLPRGELAGDDTDGHVDQLARFVAADIVVVAVDEQDNVHGGALAENLRFLRSLRSTEGRPLEVVPLPLPAAKFVGQQRLPASYCNFYILNGLVVVPQFEDPADDVAVGTLRELFPDREVRGLPALDLVWGLGAFHCLTQQEPAQRDDTGES